MKSMLNKQRLVCQKKHNSISAFTLIELILVVLIIAVLTSIVSLTLSNLIPRANLSTTTEILLAEIRQQQSRAMSREKNQYQEASEYGVYIEQNQYTLFSGTSYNPSNSSNLITEIPAPLELSSNFPSQTIIFAKGSGEIINFVDGQNVITVTDTVSNQIKTLNFNPYGIPE